MIKVLLITEKYVDPDPQFGLTNNMHNVIGSLESSGFPVSYEHLFISPEDIWDSATIDHELLSRDYDVAIISVFHKLPSEPVAAQISNRLFLLWWDAVVSDAGVRHWANYCQNLIFDWGLGQVYPNVHAMQVPQDVRIYRPDGLLEDLDVSFAGGVGNRYPERQHLLELIKDAGINVLSVGGRGNGYDNYSVHDYASIFRRSKICLNFAQGHNRVQRKGRVFEIAASAQFLFSNAPSALDGWFVDGVEYASFDENDLVPKIHYFLQHPEEREIMAARMYQKYLDLYHPKHFWGKIFHIAGAI